MSGWRKRQIANSVEKENIMTHLVSQLLDKTQESFTITRCSNGFIVEQSGRRDEDYKTVKLLCFNRDVLNEVITDIINMPMD